MAESSKAPHRVTVVGTGAIGSAVVRHLLAAGYDVTVWNRTQNRATELVAAGARQAPTLQEAVSSSPLTLLTLTNYAALEQCLTALTPTLSGHTLVGIYTGTPREAQLAAQRATGLGAKYLDAGIQSSPDMLGTDSAAILYSGSRLAFDQHDATLDLLSKPRFVGEAPEAAAVWDLALFGLWYDAQLGLLRALDAARNAGIDVAEFSRTATTQLGHVITAVPATAAELQQAGYPAGPADLTEHLTVIRHLIELRAGRPLGDGGLPQAAARIEALVAAGHGTEGLTATVG